MKEVIEVEEMKIEEDVKKDTDLKDWEDNELLETVIKWMSLWECGKDWGKRCGMSVNVWKEMRMYGMRRDVNVWKEMCKSWELGKMWKECECIERVV